MVSRADLAGDCTDNADRFLEQNHSFRLKDPCALPGDKALRKKRHYPCESHPRTCAAQGWDFNVREDASFASGRSQGAHLGSLVKHWPRRQCALRMLWT
jgi:hypothetical protein